MRNRKFKRIKSQIAGYLAENFEHPKFWVREDFVTAVDIKKSIYANLNIGRKIKLLIPYHEKSTIHVDLQLNHDTKTSLVFKLKLKRRPSHISESEMVAMVCAMSNVDSHMQVLNTIIDLHNKE